MKSWLNITLITITMVIVVTVMILSIYSIVEARTFSPQEMPLPSSTQSVGTGGLLTTQSQNTIGLKDYKVMDSSIIVEELFTSQFMNMQSHGLHYEDVETIENQEYESLGNLVIDKEFPLRQVPPAKLNGEYVPKVEDFKTAERLISLNGAARSQVHNLMVCETETQITIRSRNEFTKPLTIHADKVSLNGVDLLPYNPNLPKGDTGAAGANGIAEQGQRGSTGPKGDTGEQGSDGMAGTAGAAGKVGKHGDTGPIGMKGDTGAVGDNGDKGSPVNITRCYHSVADLKAETKFPPENEYAIITTQSGDPLNPDSGSLYRSNGVDAYQFVLKMNVMGEKGITGEVGDSGPIGEKGEQGTKGNPGNIGKDGPKGERGDGAPNGPKGNPGPIGEMGEKGYKGERGDDGFTGIVGQVDIDEVALLGKLSLDVIEQDAEKVELVMKSPLWGWNSMRVYWYSTPSFTPTAQEVMNLGEVIEVPCETALLRGLVSPFVFAPPSPVFFAYHDGTTEVMFGPFLSGASQTITFSPQNEVFYIPELDFKLSPQATSSSGLLVQYQSLTENICSNVGPMVKMHAPGKCIIRAYQPGDGQYNMAEPVDKIIELVTSLT